MMGVDGVYGAWHVERRALSPVGSARVFGVPCTLLVHGTGRPGVTKLSATGLQPTHHSPITRPDSISMPSREQRALVVGVRRRKGGNLNPCPIVNTHVFRRIQKLRRKARIPYSFSYLLRIHIVGP